MKTDTKSSSARKAAYTLAAGAAVGAAGSADAAIVYSGVQDIPVGQFGSQDLNLDGDAYNDILLKNYVFGGGNYQGAYVNFFPGKVVGFSAGLNYASALAEGDLIDSTTTAGGPFSASLAYGAANPNAEFNSADGAFIGLEFPINAVSHFGWVRVTIDNAAGSFVINDWAYESEPGVGITAGAVPEPGSLGLLAAGAAGVAALRKRRRG
ncbi:PEP-CTERM motif protein [Planctomycetes bacterium MalM25]|nr:PEP-CTERM motif protein [Planctomycetes bacterium MalM25]